MIDASRKAPLVLVVDDDPVMRLVASESLSRAGFEVTQAAGGAEGLAVFRRDRPDLLLLDVDLPDLDGFAVCEELRRSSAGADVPIVMMTGHDDLESVECAYRVGATDFATKPVHWAILAHRLRYILRANESFATLRVRSVQLDLAQQLARMGSFELDLRSRHLSCSRGFRDIFGIAPELRAVDADAMLQRVVPRDREKLRQLIRNAESKGIGFDHEFRVASQDGSERVVHAQARVSFADDHSVLRLEGFAQDITERRRAEEQIRFLAYHDSLTGLANRASFRQRLQSSIEVARREQHSIAVLYLDIDHFKRINDTLGHTAGDALLCGIADRLVECVRKSDCVARSNDSTMVSRLGGDEFSILLDGISDPQDAARVARRFNISLARPIHVEGREIGVSVSIGIAIWPQDGPEAELLLRNADIAMYSAKESGRNGFQFYSRSLNSHALERLELEARLRRALESHRISVHYQPQWDMRSRRITGCEALARWNEPGFGFVPPSEFVPLAEETGLIARLCEEVLRSACRQLRAWHDAGHTGLSCAVNLSPRQFKDDRLVDWIEDVLRESGLDPRALELEITESALIYSGDIAARQLARLRALGVRITLDDFGTGYSSLSYLQRFPVSSVKIDRSFVSGIGSDPGATGIVATIASMTDSLGLRIVAEGVETDAQLRFLLERGCTEAQGALFSPALPPDELTALLQSHRSDGSRRSERSE
jgi:diguanylate cyclase (GGDEF)-like protein/PAS domain S-box-containing protein